MVDLLVRHIFSIDWPIVLCYSLLLGLIHSTMVMMASIITIEAFMILSRGHGLLTERDTFCIRINRLTLLPQTQILHVQVRRLLDLLNRIKQLQAFVGADNSLQ